MPINEIGIGKRIEEIRENEKVKVFFKNVTLSKEDLAGMLKMTIDEYNERVDGSEVFDIQDIMHIANLYKVDTNYILFGGIKWQTYNYVII